MPNYVAGVGSLSPKRMAIGDAPGKREDELGIPFVGPTGEMFDDFLMKAGIRRSEIWVTNVVKYRPPMNKIDKLHLLGDPNITLEKSIDELWENEINKLRPNVILAIGDTALEAVCGVSGIMNYRGSILLAKDGVTKVIPTIHPAALFSHSQGSKESNDYESKGGIAWQWKKIIQMDFQRAADESESSESDLPQRELVVCHDSLKLHRFFSEYQKLEKAAVDIESINCIPVCVGFAFNRHHAISIPLYRSIGNHKLTDMGENELDECWETIHEQLRKVQIIGHNFMYDEYKLSRIGFECPTVRSDTLIKTRVIFPELPIKKLHVVSSIWTREPYYKEEGKEFKLGKVKFDKLCLYNAKDCAVEYEVDEEQELDLCRMQETFNVPMMDYYYNYMMKKHKFYMKLQNNGKRVDTERKKELKKKYEDMRKIAHKTLMDNINKLIPNHYEDVNVKSFPNMWDLLYRGLKFKVRLRDPTSEDSIVALLGQTKQKEKKEILNGVLEERRIRDQLSRQINFTPDYDGRCKSAYNISATETCRSSTGILKKPLRPKKIGLADHTISAHGRLAKDIKSMFIADEGKVIIAVDASQAEARIVAVLSEDWELLDAFDKIDVHRRTAGLIFQYTQSLVLSTGKVAIVDDLPKDGPERFTGKKIRHASNYDMHKHEFMINFNTDAQKFDIPMSISEYQANKMLELFHAASPKVRKKFHQDINDALDNNRTLIDPFGGVRIFEGRKDDIYGEGYANIPQRTVAHLVQGAALRIDEELNGDESIMWAEEKHDALYLQAPENNWEPYARLMKKHMETPIDFHTYCTLKRDIDLIIPCDCSVSFKSYADFEKAKI